MTEIDPDEAAVRRALKEFDRQRRLVDQSMTMQAWLRDRDKTLGILLVCTVLIASLVGVAFAFAGSGPSLTLFAITADRATWLGWLAVVTAALSLVELVADKRGAAQRRSDSVRLLAALKAEYRVPPAAGEEVADVEHLSERYQLAMDAIQPIPERSFNRLKSAHLRKVEISKLLSKYPGISHRRARREVSKRHMYVGDGTPTPISREKTEGSGT